MPLQLGGPETLRPQTIVWDPNNEMERFEAKAKIIEFIRNGFIPRIEKSNGEVIMDPPKKDPNIGIFRILTENGDDRIVWNRHSGDEIKEAYVKFDDFIKKGYTAYAVTTTGQKGHKIDQFDPTLEEIIMVPKTMPG